MKAPSLGDGGARLEPESPVKAASASLAQAFRFSVERLTVGRGRVGRGGEPPAGVTPELCAHGDGDMGHSLLLPLTVPPLSSRPRWSHHPRDCENGVTSQPCTDTGPSVTFINSSWDLWSRQPLCAVPQGRERGCRSELSLWT